MSGLAGICNLDGRPADRAAVDRMLGLAHYRGPDGLASWASGPVALGHAALRTTPESVHERQPLVDHELDVCLTLDGRLDNRAELRASLTAAGVTPRGDTDADLLLGAYRFWGTRCPEHLIGDFAFAIWDGREQRLFCARDFLGHRPFYYHCSPKSFRWGSEPQQVLADPSLAREPNEGYVGECLAGLPVSPTETLFVGLLRLAPAHSLTVTKNGTRTFRYWNWDPDSVVRYTDDAEYAEHFRGLLEEVMQDHLRSRGPVGLYLSGGVDSSSLLGVASHLDGKAGRPCGIETYSMVFPGLSCDETPYIKSVLEHTGAAASHRHCPQPVGAPYFEAQISRYLDLPDYPNAAMGTELRTLARRRGCRVMVTGEGGDHWLTGTRFYYHDLLRKLRIPALLALLRLDHQLSGRSLRSLFGEYAAMPLIPDAVRVVAVRALGRTNGPPWMSESFCRRISLRDRLRPPLHPGRRPLAALHTARWAVGGPQVHFAELAERSAAFAGHELRDPFSDRRVVEFAFAIPEVQRQRNWETKYVLRQAVKGLIPESVRQRQTKAEFSHAFAAELAAQGGTDLFRHLALENHGWVDGDRVRAMYELVARSDFGAAPPPGLWELWRILSLERWVRAATAGSGPG